LMSPVVISTVHCQIKALTAAETLAPSRLLRMPAIQHRSNSGQ
jgi:hypothetical protein